MKRLDLLLINPGGQKSIYQGLGRKLTAIEPPVWCGFIATTLRNKGYSVKILDATAEQLDYEEVADLVIEENPTLTAVMVYGHQPSASTQNMPAAGETCRAIKDRNPEQKILIGGTHPCALPKQTLEEEAVDYVCNGEGPLTMEPLLKALKAKEYHNLKEIPALCYRDPHGCIQLTAPAPLIKNLDEEMPMMAWDLLPMDKYRAHNWHCFGGLSRQPYASFYTTLGCPYKCSFCCIHAPFKSGEQHQGMKAEVNSYRRWSPEAVVRQIDHLVQNYGVQNIKIEDEMFVLHEKHVLGICDLLIERNYNLNIWAYARIDTIRDKFLEKLKRAGFHWLGIGIESASQYVRDGVDKDFGLNDIMENCKKIRQAGINIGANFIFGLPDDTVATMQDTLDLAIELCPDWANFYSAMAYPGSQLYNTAVQKGWGLPETWIGYSQHSFDCLPLRTETLKASEVLAFRDDAFHRFFSHPRYLNYVEKRFGKETADHVIDMTKYRLPRKYCAETSHQ